MSETIGEKLKQAREERRLTLDQVAQATRIRTHYLEALERGDLSAIPSAAQARGFLRNYAGFLGLDPDSLVPAPPPPASTPDVQPESVREAESRSGPAVEARLPLAEAEPFTPARYTEELPAEPGPVAEEQTQTPVEESKLSRPTSAAKKTASKTIRSSRTGTGRKSGVKKKITALRGRRSHTKRVLSPHRLSSSRPHRLSAKKRSRTLNP